MPAEKIQLIVPGSQIPAAPDADVLPFLSLEPISSYQVTGTRRGETQVKSRIDADADALVKIEYQNGLVEWLRVDQLRADLGPSRDAGPVEVPSLLNRGAGVSRGVTDWAIKAMHFFGVSPVDAVADASARRVISNFENKLDSGLHRMRADGRFGEKITSELPPQSQPVLIFIHGTASSTQGSFRGFWRDDTTAKSSPEWASLVKTYGDRIFALEHKTFSVSPAQNTLDLARLLPADSTLHVVTHSRGGIVGELLGIGKLTPREVAAFRGRPDQQLLQNLAAELQRKNFKVEKFVRTACPAAGTILASGRLDLYLNLILNVIGLIPALAATPAYAVFKATALALIKLRADPKRIPGIEAQMPESPLIHLLNTKGRYSTSDLGVIAGDFEGSGVWGTLKSYALRAFYWTDNDFVVNTKSMSGGLERQKGVWQFLDQGDTVNHFSYFKNSRTRSHVLSWLNAPPLKPAKDFNRVRSVELRSATRGASDLPVAFIVPDVFGTHLRDSDGKRIWLDFQELANGRFTELAQEGIDIAGVHESYQKLYDALARSHDVELFAYDWRQSIATSAERLAAAVGEKLGDRKRPARFIAHGAGGLIVRQFAADDAARWQELSEGSGGLVMLGPPHFGSWRIAKMLAGRSRLVRMLSLLGMHSEAEVVAVLQGFRGLLDLLPMEMYDPAQWADVAVGRPEAELLSESREWRASLGSSSRLPRRMFSIAGSAPATPAGLTEFSPNGDGDVLHTPGNLSGVNTWYDPDRCHGDLPQNPGPAIDLLNTGATASLDVVCAPSGKHVDSQRLNELERVVLFPSETDLTDEAFARCAEAETAMADPPLRVRVMHGHLREAKYPVAVGHYAGDTIVSAEAELDRTLEGRLSTRFHMDLYPGPVGTAAVVNAPDAHPPGALVLGLGEIGEVSPDKVRRGTLEAVLRYALLRLEEPLRDNEALPRSAAFSSMLIGISGGRAITIADSVNAIVSAAIEANRVLRRRNLLDQIRIDEVQFVELFEDTAIEAAHAAAAVQNNLKNDLEPSERIEFDGRMKQTPGGLVYRPVTSQYETGWWRRILIARDRCDRRRDTASANLVFESLTDRARAEQMMNSSQRKLVDELLEEATHHPVYDEDSAVALFELLVPNALKDQSSENADLVLVLDAAGARYPWELMAERTKRRVLPLSVRMGMIRQLRVDQFRQGPRGARELSALVVGDTMSDLPELTGAQEEARTVADLLASHGYSSVPPLIRETPANIIRRLFSNEYRILHLAAHGVYDAEHPERSGMVLSRDVFLTAMELRQLRALPELVFINCCHLGNIDQPLHVKRPHEMAASIAQELISCGVKAVVAAGWAVDDTAAVVFARSFYNQMLSGVTFGKAVKHARLEARAIGDNNTWGAYQCYGNPDFLLTSQQAEAAARSRVFFSHRECVDELRDIASSAAGAPREAVEALQTRTIATERLLSGEWRNGESLFALAEARKSAGDLEGAIAAYEEALRISRSRAPVFAVEQLANVMDRRAAQIFPDDPDRARQLWDGAAGKLERLNDLLGKDSERLALAGALHKRRARFDTEHRAELYKQAAELYLAAYQNTLDVERRIDPFPGLNAIALAYLAGTTSPILEECCEEATRSNDGNDFWARIYKPDAMLHQHLAGMENRPTIDAIVKAYRAALPHGTPHERDSVIQQLHFLRNEGPEAGRATIDAVLQQLT